MKFTLQDIEKSKVAGINRHLLEKLETRKKKIVKARNDCPEVQWLNWQLKAFCEDKGLLLVPEHKFLKDRKFRLDFAIFRGITEEQARKLQYGKENIVAAQEYEGTFSTHSRHTNKMGYSKDTDKYRLAALEGWTVFRYTKLNYLTVLEDLEKFL